MNTARAAASMSERAVEPSDWELVQRAREGDREAFRELVERYQRKIAALALGMLRNREDALDVVQETFAKAYQSLDRFKGDASFYTWLYRIARQPLHRPPAPRGQACRRSPLEPSDERGEDGRRCRSARRRATRDEPFERARDAEIARALREAIAELTPEHRAVILLREVEGLSYEEISQVLQCPEGHRDEPPALRAPPAAGAAPRAALIP